MDGFKETTLKGHIQLCELRYRNLEEKISAIETRITQLENKVAEVKKEMATGFGDIRVLLEKQNSSKTTQVIATIGAIVVAAITATGYILVH